MSSDATSVRLLEATLRDASQSRGDISFVECPVAVKERAEQAELPHHTHTHYLITH